MTRRRLLVMALAFAGILVLLANPSAPVHHRAPTSRAVIRYADPRAIPPPLPRDEALDRETFSPENPPRKDQPLADQPPPPGPARLPIPPAFGEHF